jgi:Ca2+/Na+ antiporter
MARNSYQIGMELDRNIINWSSLALTGLLALGVSAHGEPSFNAVLWALAVAFFAFACFFTHRNMQRSVRQHDAELDNFTEAIPPEQSLKEDKAIERGNTVFLLCFVLGAAFSIALIGKIVVF